MGVLAQAENFKKNHMS
ncbi:hypothetical protein [Escherichia coli]